MGACNGRTAKDQNILKKRFKGNANPKDFILEKKPIGKGIFKRLYKGTLASDPNQIIVAKAFNKTMLTEEEIDQIHEEARRLTEIEHPNIAKYYDSYELGDYLYVVSEYIEGKPLSYHIDSFTGLYTETAIGEMFLELFEALNYIHTKDILHRNIIANNVILDNKGSLRLIDFGLARITNNEHAIKRDGEVEQYIAPEAKHLGFMEKSDCYSMGVLLYLVFTKKLPYSGGKIIGTFKQKESKVTFNNPCWKEYSFEIPALIRKLVTRDPTKRLSARDALKEKWFTIVKIQSTDDDEPNMKQDVIDALEDFYTDSIFQKCVLNKLALMISDEETSDIRKTFHAIDTDHNGKITFNELKLAMRKIDPQYSDSDVREIIKEVSTSSSKDYIDLNEFIAATMDRSEIAGRPIIKELFKLLDKNKDDKLDIKDIVNEFPECSKFGREIFKTYNSEKEGYLTFEDFEKRVIRIN